jgi:hypothetical protein
MGDRVGARRSLLPAVTFTRWVEKGAREPLLVRVASLLTSPSTAPAVQDQKGSFPEPRLPLSAHGIDDAGGCQYRCGNHDLHRQL